MSQRQRLRGQNYSQTEHLMAQIDQAHAAGYTGKGQKIAIIDSWIDYTHPALGGCLGEGCLVSFSREWLEEDDKNNPDPECKSHATFIAGWTPGYRGGMAPGEQLGSYAIAGCTHGGNDEKLLQALDQSMKDGVTAVVYSMGYEDGWSNYALNLAFDEASRRGLLIVAPAGNEGASGVFRTIRPAEATEVLGVGSVNNAYEYALANVSTYTQKSGADDDGKAVEFVWRDGTVGSGATGWNNMVLPLWSNLSLYETGKDCDALFPDDVPDLSNRLVLVPRTARYGSGCLDTTLADRAAAKDAAYVMLVDNDEGEGIEIVRVNTPAIHAIAMTHRSQGDEWLRLLQFGAEIMVDMTAPPDKRSVLVAPKRPGGGRMSSSSNWGPTYDGYLPTSVSAPGDDLLTTKAGGGWIISSGTSLSGPFAAAVAALVAEARGTKDWRVLRSLLSTTASPLVRAASRDV
ncbi:hypothetical protein PG997_002292 [Apiospora hydei]|uniref:Peptidase S8/S53 domain-containing protein n=1 Tax=Apiospora hydei TaxID=1337664 RepID=A0ABR1X8Y7_9PEZI